jgi:hypothetical protein
MTIYKGDDTSSFGGGFLTIDLQTNSQATITKAVFVSGEIKKTFDNPTFPIKVDLTPEDTKKLKYNNIGYLIVYDKDGRPKMCDGYITFSAKDGVI